MQKKNLSKYVKSVLHNLKVPPRIFLQKSTGIFCGHKKLIQNFRNLSGKELTGYQSLCGKIILKLNTEK
jgi:hypothetical protein